jgi:hypothetical protein
MRTAGEQAVAGVRLANHCKTLALALGDVPRDVANALRE